MWMAGVRRSTPVEALLVATIAAAAAALPLLVNGCFYYADDNQTYFTPMFGEIARLLEAGEYPLATDRVWYGGAILAEYQYGVLNPICLLLILIAHRFADLAHAAAFYAIAHYAIYASGAYVLGIGLGFGRRAAATGALLAASSTWLLYWGAGDWIPALVSLSYVPWCLAALLGRRS